MIRNSASSLSPGNIACTRVNICPSTASTADTNLYTPFVPPNNLSCPPSQLTSTSATQTAMYGQQNNYGAPPPQQWGQAPPQGYQPGYQNGPPAVNYGAHPSQQQQWGAPPGPPQHQPYGAPPVNQYGAPPQHQQGYGGHSPQPPFGAPSPAPAGYGAPPTVPQGQYGAPSPYSQQPPQQGFGGPQQGYGSQPQGQSPMMYLGVPIPAPPPAVPVSTLAGYDARFDAERIRKATKVCIPAEGELDVTHRCAGLWYR